MKELKPCPFCGGEPTMCWDSETMNMSQRNYIKCADCGGRGGYPEVNFWRCGYDDTSRGITVTEAEAITAHDEEAISNWNSRKS